MDDSFLSSGAMISLGNDRFLVGYGKRIWLEKPQAGSYSFYFPDFFLTNVKPWFVHEICHEITRKALLNYLQPSLLPIQWSLPSKDFFTWQFQLLQESKLEKGVPYTFIEALWDFKSQSVSAILYNMLKQTTDIPQYPYGFWDNTEGIIGATPELLFSFDHIHLKTAACAGTRPTDNPVFRQKETREHQIVVKGIIESLKPFGNALAEPTQHLQLQKILHLVSPIHMQLFAAVSFTDIVQALHPTPALGTYPKQTGMAWLHAIQKQHNRKRYGAPIGYINPDGSKGCCWVGIRNVQWEESILSICAGCGITQESDFNEEWSEIEWKLSSILELCGCK